MTDDMLTPPLGRRDFLRGSALFAAALGLSVAPGFASPQQPPARPPAKKDASKPKPADPSVEDEKAKRDKTTLIDKEGRAYRVCPQCAYNMYKQGRMWVCENCGYSYVD